MPNIKSAKKRVVVNDKKNSQNKMIRSAVKTAIKKFNAALAAGDAETAEKLLPETVSVIDSAASKGILHKNNAANKKSALAKSLNALKAAPVATVAQPVVEQPKAEPVATPAPAEVTEDKPKKTRAKKAAEEETAPAEEKPKKTRAKKATAEKAE